MEVVVLDEQIVWVNRNLINIQNDPIAQSGGQFEILDNNIKLVDDQFIKYVYTYNTSGDYIKANKLLLSLSMTQSDDTLKTRYNQIAFVDIAVRYWAEDQQTPGTYNPGSWVYFRIFPYLKSESLGYTDSYVLNLDDQFINTIEISFNSKLQSGTFITIADPIMRYSITVDDAISQYVDSDKIEKITMYNDGMITYYQGVSEPLTLKVLEIVPNKQYVIDVNAEYNFNLNIDDGNLP